MAGEHKRGVIYSAGLHVFMLLLAVFGLPSFMRHKDPPPPMVIAVEIMPISPLTNVKPSDLPLSQEEKPEPKQTTPTPPPPTPPAPAEDTPPPPPEPKPVEKPPEPKKEEKKKEEKKPDPKKEEKKKTKEKSLDEILKNLKDQNKKKQSENKPEEKKPEEDAGTKAKSKAPNYNPDMPMSMSELDAIRSQMAKCWSVPAGAKNAADLAVTLRVQLQQDGTVIQVGLADESKARYSADSFYQAAADSAMRAVRQCSPLKNLPPDKYQTWRDIIMTFDPKEMLF